MAQVGRKWTPEEYRQRPTELDLGLARQIIDRYANGETLIEITDDDRDMPTRATFLRWVSRDPDLAREYEEAGKIRLDILVDEMTYIADNTRDPTQARAQIDARKFQAERLAPKKYGPRAFNVATTPEADNGGLDAAAEEVRRKLQRMAAQADRQPAQPES